MPLYSRTRSARPEWSRIFFCSSAARGRSKLIARFACSPLSASDVDRVLPLGPSITWKWRCGVSVCAIAEHVRAPPGLHLVAVGTALRRGLRQRHIHHPPLFERVKLAIGCALPWRAQPSAPRGSTLVPPPSCSVSTPPSPISAPSARDRARRHVIVIRRHLHMIDLGGKLLDLALRPLADRTVASARIFRSFSSVPVNTEFGFSVGVPQRSAHCSCRAELHELPSPIDARSARRPVHRPGANGIVAAGIEDEDHGRCTLLLQPV